MTTFQNTNTIETTEPTTVATVLPFAPRPPAEQLTPGGYGAVISHMLTSYKTGTVFGRRPGMLAA